MTIKKIVEKYHHQYNLLRLEKCYVCGSKDGYIIWEHKDKEKYDVCLCEKCHIKAKEYIKHKELQKLRIEKIKRLKD